MLLGVSIDLSDVCLALVISSVYALFVYIYLLLCEQLYIIEIIVYKYSISYGLFGFVEI